MGEQKDMSIAQEQGGETFDVKKLTLEQIEAVLEHAKTILFEEGLSLKRPGGAKAYVEDGESGYLTNGLPHLEALMTGSSAGNIDFLTQRRTHATPEAAMDFIRKEVKRMGYDIRTKK